MMQCTMANLDCVVQSAVATRHFAMSPSIFISTLDTKYLRYVHGEERACIGLTTTTTTRSEMPHTHQLVTCFLDLRYRGPRESQKGNKGGTWQGLGFFCSEPRVTYSHCHGHGHEERTVGSDALPCQT